MRSGRDRHQTPQQSRVHPVRRHRATDREILRLAVPAFLALVAEPLFLLADAAFIGHLGTPELAGLGIAGAVLQTAVGLCVSLLATLKQFLGAAWTEELAADWAAAYGVIARTMVEAAEDSSDTSPAWWEAEVLATERRTMDVTVIQIRPEPTYDYSPGQSFAMEIPQRPRLWRYFSPANAPREDGTIELHVQQVDGG